MSPWIDFQALGAQHVDEAPPAFQRHVGIAAALQNEVPVEYAVAQVAANQRTRVPGVTRARAGPDSANVVTSLMVDAGLRGVSPLRLAISRPESRIDDREADGMQRKTLRGGGAHHGRRGAGNGERSGG